MPYIALALLILTFSLIGTITKIFEHDPHGYSKDKAAKSLSQMGKVNYFRARLLSHPSSTFYIKTNSQCMGMRTFPKGAKLFAHIERIGYVTKLSFRSAMPDPVHAKNMLPLHVEYRFLDKDRCSGHSWAYSPHEEIQFTERAEEVAAIHQERVEAFKAEQQRIANTPKPKRPTVDDMFTALTTGVDPLRQDAATKPKKAVPKLPERRYDYAIRGAGPKSSDVLVDMADRALFKLKFKATRNPSDTAALTNAITLWQRQNGYPIQTLDKPTVDILYNQSTRHDRDKYVYRGNAKAATASTESATQKTEQSSSNAATATSSRPYKKQTLRISRADWRRVQAGLKKLGYNPGPIDGVPGAQTSAAILKWQTGNFRIQTGILTESQANAILRKADRK
ncbi:MAG: peptidoglycan-binding domain-containing protein [Pseudomonadota bacterium]